MYSKQQNTKQQSKALTKNKRQNKKPSNIFLSDSFLRRITAPTPFGDEFTTQLRYGDVRKLTTDATPGILGTEQTWVLGSCYDFDLTNAGHQPSGFDQLTPFFNYYQVMKVDLKVKWCGSNSNTLMAFMAMQSGQNTTALAGTSCTLAFERQDVLSRQLPIAGRDVWEFKEEIPLHRVVGLTPVQYAGDPNYRGATGASPTSAIYLRMSVGDAGSGVSTNAIVCTEAIFHVRFFEKIAVPPS